MDKTKINKINKLKPGKFMTIIYESVYEVPAFGTVKRLTKSVVRVGVNYTHLKACTKSSGTTHLPWGKWSEESPFIIEYKDNYYLRVCLDSNRLHKPQTVYGQYNELTKKYEPFDINGLDEATKTRVAKINKGHSNTVLTINLNNIKEINQGGLKIW